MSTNTELELLSVREVAAQLGLSAKAVSAEPEELLKSGDQVAVVLKIRARPRESNVEIEIRNGHLWAFRDGKAQSMRIFPEPEKALEAAGLRE